MRQKLFPEFNLDNITAPMAVSKAYNAGNNLDCGSIAQSSTYESIKQGWMSEETLDVAVYNLFLARMKTGEFDSNVEYQKIKKRCNRKKMSMLQKPKKQLKRAGFYLKTEIIRFLLKILYLT